MDLELVDFLHMVTRYFDDLIASFDFRILELNLVFIVAHRCLELGNLILQVLVLSRHSSLVFIL